MRRCLAAGLALAPCRRRHRRRLAPRAAAIAISLPSIITLQLQLQPVPVLVPRTTALRSVQPLPSTLHSTLHSTLPSSLPSTLHSPLLALQLKREDEDAALGIFNDDKAHLVVALTTDRGLCGSVNNSIGRSLRKELEAAAKAGSNVRLFVLGDKGRSQIARDYSPIVARSVDSYLDR